MKICFKWSKTMFIDNIFELDKIFSIEKQVIEKRHIPVTNISYWGVSKEYQDYMSKYILLNFAENIFSYKYTYDVPYESREKIIKKLGCLNAENTMCLFTSSTTQSIINIVNYLKLFNYRKLCILNPAYFSVEESCKIIGMPYEKKNLIFSNNEYVIPIEDIFNNNYDAVWLTSPVYSAGVVFSSSQISKIKSLIDSGVLVIADESLALPGQELLHEIPVSKYFFSIISPHKPLYINNIKFSAILCPKENDDFLEQWIDVLNGSLLHSNLVAISHYLSINYRNCVDQSYKWFQKGKETIDIVLKSFPYAYCDTTDISPYKCIYLRTQKSKNISSLNNIQELISTQFVSYIPGIYNGFETDYCFRVNMSLGSTDLENALYRILCFYA